MQDRRDRLQVPQERREALLAEFTTNGVSGAEFARLAGVNYALDVELAQGSQRASGGVGAVLLSELPPTNRRRTA